MGIYASITKSWCQHYKLNYNVTLDVIIDEQIWMINVVANLVKRAYDRFETNYFVLLSTSEISKFREYGSTETWMKLQRQSCRLKISFTANRNDQAPKTIQKTVLNLMTFHIRMWNLNEKIIIRRGQLQRMILTLKFLLINLISLLILCGRLTRTYKRYSAPSLMNRMLFLSIG